MNLMIVEDEIRILNSLAYNIPWERHDIEVVGLAANGVEALAVMKRRKPDLLLLDIEMPEMNGLTLAETVLRQEPQTRIIILSGHDDFAFAQRAVELGVTKYLLKPAGDDEILSAVLAAAEEVRRELTERHNVSELQRMWHRRLPQLQEDFLRGWVMERYAEWERHMHAEELKLGLKEYGRFAVAVCEMDPLPAEASRFLASDAPLLQFSLECIAKEFLQGEACRVFNDVNGSTVLLFMERPDVPDAELTKRINVLVSRLLGVVKQCLKLTASAGLGTVCGAADVTKSYRQARRALQERAIYGNEIAIPYLDVKSGEHSIAFDPDFERRLEMAVQTDESARIQLLIDEYFGNAFTIADSSEPVYEHLLYVSSVFIRIIQSRGWSIQKVLESDYAFFLSLDSLVTKEQIWEWAKRAAARIVTYKEQERKSSSNRLIKSMLEMVERMLAEDLSLHTLAERLYVNPSYLSRLFKKETGEAFSNYVLKRRMERAKELLQQDARVYDAASAVGYRDVSYFAKVFRGYWGVAPSEWK
ncbi:response regulator [Paenibacillus harenae]|uniref:response regulator n=1 Tax=Paenibacillus harenae TaxID=306543 RepID=UPI0003FAE477|nr:response regulator [Paenibacillus harenae]